MTLKLLDQVVVVRIEALTIGAIFLPLVCCVFNVQRARLMTVKLRH